MKPLKLDFNERADSIPEWLQQHKIDLNSLWLYPDRAQVEQRIAAELGIENDAVLMTNGGDESIELLFKYCKLNQLRMVVPEPCFSQYTHGQSIWQLDALFIPGKDDLCIDQTAVIQSLQPNDWLVLTRPNNPTGEFIAQDDFEQLLKAAQQAGAQVFLDEAYIEFAMQDATWINWSKRFNNVVILRSFSKAFGLAGARLGYLVGESHQINQFRRLAMPFNVSSLNLQIARLGLDNRDEVLTYCQQIVANKTQVQQFLQSKNIKVCDSAANFLLISLHPLQKKMLTNFTAAHGIQIKAEMAGLPECVRITIPFNAKPLLDCLAVIFDPQILGFDMDGVLIDTSASYDQCIQQTVFSFTQEKPAIDDIIQLRESGGFNNDWKLAYELILQRQFTVNYTDVVNKFQALYHGTDIPIADKSSHANMVDENNSNQDEIGLKSNEINLLTEQCKSKLVHLCSQGQEKTICAVITGRPRKEAEDGLQQLDFKPELLVSADDVNAQKPDPEGIMWVKNQSQKSRMWYCGDTVDDMQAGHAAGCVCIGVGNNEQLLYAAGAHLVIENINQLEKLL